MQVNKTKVKVEKNDSPQPKPSNVDPQVRSPVVTFKTETSITTPMRSPSTKTSSSTPSDITRSDSSEQKAQTSNNPQEEPKDISELLSIKTPKDLEDVNDLLDNFLGKADKSRKKEPTKPREDSMEEHVSSVEKKRKEHAKMHYSPTNDNMKEPFGEVVNPPRTVDRISPNSEGGMSLKSVQEFEDEAAKTKLKTILEAEGIDIEEKNLNIFLPDEAKMNKDSRTNVMSEFVRDLYESAGVIEPLGDDTTSMRPPKADLLAESTFASDAYQCAETAGDGEWKTPKTNKKGKKPKNPCDQLSPLNVFHQIISKATGVPMASSDSASDSTVYNSPNRNSYSPLSEDNNDDGENPNPPPITDIESILAVNDQTTPREASNVHEDEPEQKGDEGDNAIYSTQEDPVNQDFHKAESE